MRLVSLLLALLLFSATLVESFHHHDDGVAHDDCPICMAAGYLAGGRAEAQDPT
jgi:hypothetical protein